MTDPTLPAPSESEWGDADLPAWLSEWADDVCYKAPYPDHGYAPTQRVMGYVRWLEARVFVDYTDTDEELAMANAWGQEAWAWVDDFCEAIGEGTTVFNFKESIAALTTKLAAAEAALNAIGPHKGKRSCRGLPTCPYCIAAAALRDEP